MYWYDKMSFIWYTVIINLKHWCELDDLMSISQTDKDYKRYTDIEYNERLIEHLGQMIKTEIQFYSIWN